MSEQSSYNENSYSESDSEERSERLALPHPQSHQGQFQTFLPPPPQGFYYTTPPQQPFSIPTRPPQQHKQTQKRHHRKGKSKKDKKEAKHSGHTEIKFYFTFN